MTDERFTVDSDGKYWDRIEKRYVTIDNLFTLVEKLDRENEQLKEELLQCKAVINKKWSEYLKKKELIE
jgi:hypothetical protein